MGLTWTGPAAEGDGQDTTYVTKISVPCFDNGIQRLRSWMLREPPEPDRPEPEAS
jgi:hypothetical protein